MRHRGRQQGGGTAHVVRRSSRCCGSVCSVATRGWQRRGCGHAVHAQAEVGGGRVQSGVNGTERPASGTVARRGVRRVMARAVQGEGRADAGRAATAWRVRPCSVRRVRARTHGQPGRRGRSARWRAALQRARGGEAGHGEREAGGGSGQARRERREPGLAVLGSRERGKKGGKSEREKKKREKRKGKRIGEKRKKMEKEMKKMGKRGKRERKRRGAVRASGDRGCGRPRLACGPREVGHAVGGERGKRREGKRGGGIRGGRSRRVALDGKEMGRELNSGVGLFG